MHNKSCLPFAQRLALQFYLSHLFSECFSSRVSPRKPHLRAESTRPPSPEACGASGIYCRNLRSPDLKNASSPLQPPAALLNFNHPAAILQPTSASLCKAGTSPHRPITSKKQS